MYDRIKVELQNRLNEMEQLIKESGSDPRFAEAVRSAKLEAFELQQLIAALDGDAVTRKSALERMARLEERNRAQLRSALDRIADE